jgi:LysR family malonate utilization transcriptional regulator
MGLMEEITLRKLETLLAYLETCNLRRAAEQLEVSTVSVHRALHSLEDALDCPLFRHEGRELLPTSAALALADAARVALKTLHDGVLSARAVGGWSDGRIRIGSLYSLGFETLPRLVTDMRQLRPDVQAEVTMGSNAELLAHLRAGTADAALMAIPPDEPDIESIALFDDQMYFATPIGSRYARLGAVDLAACVGERFVTLRKGFATRDGFDAAFGAAGFTPKLAMQVGDIFTLINLVGGGLGCTLLPGRVREALGGKVELIPLQSRYQVRQQIGLNYLRARQRDPNLVALASACRSVKLAA